MGRKVGIVSRDDPALNHLTTLGTTLTYLRSPIHNAVVLQDLVPIQNMMRFVVPEVPNFLELREPDYSIKWRSLPQRKSKTPATLCSCQTHKST